MYSELAHVIQDIVHSHHRPMVAEMTQLRKRLFHLAAQDHPSHYLRIQLAKLFDRFSRDFTRHMDTEERYLFPFLLARTHQKHDVTSLRVDPQVLEDLALEDRVVGSEFGRIRQLTLGLCESAANHEYREILTKIKELENNLTEHTEKERKFIEPVLKKYLPRESGDADFHHT